MEEADSVWVMDQACMVSGVNARPHGASGFSRALLGGPRERAHGKRREADLCGPTEIIKVDRLIPHIGGLSALLSRWSTLSASTSAWTTSHRTAH